MHISTDWLLHHHIILAVYGDVITDDSLMIGQKTILRELDSIEHSVHLILEVTVARQFAKDIVGLTAIREVANPILRHPNLDWVVVVDPIPHPVFKMIGFTLTQVARSHLFVCKSRQHAIDFLYSADDTLQFAQD